MKTSTKTSVKTMAAYLIVGGVALVAAAGIMQSDWQQFSPFNQNEGGRFSKIEPPKKPDGVLCHAFSTIYSRLQSEYVPDKGLEIDDDIGGPDHRFFNAASIRTLTDWKNALKNYLTTDLNNQLKFERNGDFRTLLTKLSSKNPGDLWGGQNCLTVPKDDLIWFVDDFAAERENALTGREENLDPEKFIDSLKKAGEDKLVAELMENKYIKRHFELVAIIKELESKIKELESKIRSGSFSSKEQAEAEARALAAQLEQAITELSLLRPKVNEILKKYKGKIDSIYGESRIDDWLRKICANQTYDDCRCPNGKKPTGGRGKTNYLRDSYRVCFQSMDLVQNWRTKKEPMMGFTVECQAEFNGCEPLVEDVGDAR